MNYSLKKQVFSIVYAVFVVSILFTNSIQATELKFSAIPHQNYQAEKLLYKKVALFLSTKLGVQVSFVPSKNYSETIRLFKTGEIQFAWFGGLSGVMARKQTPGSTVVAQGFEDEHFKSYFIAHNDSNISNKKELFKNARNLSMLFGPKLSTSGRLMPEFFIRKIYMKSPEDLFKSIAYSKNHQDTINKVANKETDVGVVNYSEWIKNLQNGKIEWDNLLVVWETPTYNDYHWLVHPSVNNQFDNINVEKITNAILSMSANRNVMRVFSRSHFIKAGNNDYRNIEQIGKTLGILK